KCQVRGNPLSRSIRAIVPEGIHVTRHRHASGYADYEQNNSQFGQAEPASRPADKSWCSHRCFGNSVCRPDFRLKEPLAPVMTAAAECASRCKSSLELIREGKLDRGNLAFFLD